MVSSDNNVRKILKLLVPPVFLLLFQRLLSLTGPSASRANPEILRKNAQLKGAGNGRRAFLLATGPSVKQEDLSLLAGEDCFSVSNFFLHENIDIINPKFHFFAPYHKPLIRDNFADWLRLADHSLPKETKIFLGAADEKIVREYNLFKERDVHYIEYDAGASEDEVNLENPITPPKTGPLMILPVLFYMGYSNVYLIGCDHTVLRDYKKNPFVTNFYNSEKDVRKSSVNTIWLHSTIGQIECELNVFKKYDNYSKLSEKIGIKVVNLSKDSWLDSFDFQTLDKVIKTSPGK